MYNKSSILLKRKHYLISMSSSLFNTFVPTVHSIISGIINWCEKNCDLNVLVMMRLEMKRLNKKPEGLLQLFYFSVPDFKMFAFWVYLATLSKYFPLFSRHMQLKSKSYLIF